MTVGIISENLKNPNLSSKQKKKIGRMNDKVRDLSEEKNIHEQEEKKLTFKLKNLSRDRDVLLGKIEEKDDEVRELSASKSRCGEELLGNDKPFKKLLTALTFKSKELEEKNNQLKREIDDIEKKVEKVLHFMEKHRKKEDRLAREIDGISKTLGLLLKEKKGIEAKLRGAEKSLEETEAAY